MSESHVSQKRYPPELKERAVRMAREAIREQGSSQGVIPRIARQLGIGVESLRVWVLRAEVDSGARPGTTSSDAERLKELERENRELRPEGVNLFETILS